MVLQAHERIIVNEEFYLDARVYTLLIMCVLHTHFNLIYLCQFYYMYIIYHYCVGLIKIRLRLFKQGQEFEFIGEH